MIDNNLVNNKRGWLKIVEAFTAVLLIMGVLLYTINQGYISDNRSGVIYDTQVSILREIQVNEELRGEVLDANAPVESNDAGFPEPVKTRINNRIPDYLECIAKICEAGTTCNLDFVSVAGNSEIYAQSTIITVTLGSESYDPRRLKLFCWVK